MLQKLKNAICSMPPSSVETERTFSASGLFVTKLRTRMSDEMLNTLCILRAYLMPKKPRK